MTTEDAHAFAWMVRHGYQACVPCHADPSGSGILTSYGRAIEDTVVRTRFAEEVGNDETSPQFLWGLTTLPDGLSLQGDVRYLHLAQKVDWVPVQKMGIWMQADFAAALQIKHMTASASIGYADRGALEASLTNAREKNLVSRTHWAGYSFLDDALMVRAGRMNLPFGLRVFEHTLWARAYTRTSINADQQYGVAASYQHEKFRAELMGIIGNFQISPDAYRERGYSGYIEWTPKPKMSLGLSSLITYRALDAVTLAPTWRQAHGLFGRWATPWDPLVVQAEWDYALESSQYNPKNKGIIGFLTADVEALSGVHVMGTFETSTYGVGDVPLSWGTWLSYQWFCLPQADIRLDSIFQRTGSAGAADTDVVTFLFQAHVKL
ncbi:MAG TPA: hypothetical protein VFK05_02140 [Polyangiaceae bacterium]|nr:hypothetical protein [Polyangiaceae bacterium]